MYFHVHNCYVDISSIEIFPSFFSPISGLVVWCSQEIKYLTSHLTSLLFVPQVSLSVLAECIVAVRSHCDQVYIIILLRVSFLVISRVWRGFDIGIKIRQFH